MKKVLDFILGLQFIFRPNYWVMNNRYSSNWDSELNQLMEEYNFTEIKNCTAKLGDKTIWISNYPYATFYPYEGFSVSRVECRPSRLTIIRAKKKLDEAMISQFGRVKSEDERFREQLSLLDEHRSRINEIRNEISTLRDSIRNHPSNVSIYKNDKSLFNNTKIRKHTVKHG